MTSDGETIGHVKTVDEDVVHVTPEGSVDDAIRQKLGWMTEEGEVYELPHSAVATIDDHGIHLK